MINTTLCYIEKDNKFLMLCRNKKKNDLNAQKWIGVGGKFEAGESADECLLREVYEETGLRLSEYTLVGLIKFLSDIYEDEDMYLYTASDFTGEVLSSCSEGTLEWVERDKVLSLPTWEGDRYFLKPLLEGKTGLNMTVRYEGDKLVELRDDTEDVVAETSGLIISNHGFSTKIGGVSENEFATLNLGMNRGDIRERVCENWRRFLISCGISYRPFVCGRQVHGNCVKVVSEKDARLPYGEGELIEADGYVTDMQGVPLVIFTADCVPVLLEDYEAGVVGAVHCGWRSSVADIEAEVIEAMRGLGAKTSRIKVAIGAAIGKCCFEVGYEVIEAVDKLLTTEEAAKFYNAKPDGKYMLDLRGVVRRRFEMLGVPADNIEILGECTMCHPKKYYSHRYTKGVRGSLACVIMR